MGWSWSGSVIQDHLDYTVYIQHDCQPQNMFRLFSSWWWANITGNPRKTVSYWYNTHSEPQDQLKLKPVFLWIWLFAVHNETSFAM